jgi:hypothetical protein
LKGYMYFIYNQIILWGLLRHNESWCGGWIIYVEKMKMQNNKEILIILTHG